MAPQSSDSKPLFQKDEKALCFHGEMLYDAKITDVKRTDPKETKSPFHYKVHYKGWKNTWDDWVPQDRLRKPTEDNRELAAHLRQQAILKANPKMAGKTRRGQGSEIGSGRGSEERTSSVPAAGGRGSKRARDNDLEKVGGDSPSHKRTRVRDRDSRHDDIPPFDMIAWIADLPASEKARKYASKVKKLPKPNLDIENPLDAESITSIIAHLSDVDNNMDQPTTVDDNEDKPKTADDKEDKPKTPDGKEDKPTTVDDNGDQPTTLDDKEDKLTTEDGKEDSKPSQSVEQRRNDEIDLRQFVYVPRKAAVKATTALAEANSKQLSVAAPSAKKTTKKTASKSSSSAATKKADAATPSPHNVPAGLSKKTLSNSETVTSRTKDTKVVSGKGKANVGKKSDATKAQPKAQQASGPNRSHITANPDGEGVPSDELLSDAKPEDKFAGIKDEESEVNVVTSLRRSVRTAAAVSTAKVKSQIQSMATSFSRTINQTHASSPTPSSQSSTSSKTLRSSTATKPGARKRGKPYTMQQHRGPKHQLPPHFEELPSDIDSDNEDHGAAPATIAPGAPFEVDPPGSNTPLDALKFPYRLIEKINRDGDRFPLGWTEEHLKCIPDHCLVWVREELLVKMPYSVLENRPHWVLKEVPDNAPFWDQWERENEAKIINAFVTKVKGRPNDDHYALNVLASLATDRAFEDAARASRSFGKVTTDKSEERCKKCVKFGVKCDGVKPVCHSCKQAGRECDFSISMDEESYGRRGSVDDRQQEFANLSGDNLDVALRARVPATRAITGLDVLALAAEVVESGAADRVQSNPLGNTKDPGYGNGSDSLGNTQDAGYGNGSGSPSLRGLFPMLQLAKIAESLFHDFDLERGTPAYLNMPSQEDAFYTRPSIRITIPDHLKNLLVDDWENVTKSLLLVPLPSQAPANFIIDEYFNEEKMNRRLCSPEADILEEFCAGLKMYFEKAVGKILLYRFERSQLAEVRKLWESGRYKEWEGKGPGDCYGAEHLTRMIVNLPEMIAQTNMDLEAVARLKTELSKFSIWLSRNSTKYFCAKYEKPSAEYIENAR
ncbi:RNA binding activity-knot of a chromodomain-containing protein [Cladophialophora immunda]|nr:RNA binding activity-knot of a chromodomain-containing protein [Cladophialophora immunda]